MTNRTIWVIDDDVIYKTIMKKIIKKAAIFDTPITFTNGKEAVDALIKTVTNKEQVPEIILLDIEMPILDGWGFMVEIEKLKSKLEKFPKIYISSSSIAVEDKAKAKNNPDILGYMSKPISLEDLLLIASTE